MASAERNDEAPNGASLGAMGSLLRRLDMLPCTHDILELKICIRTISDNLKKLSEVQDPPLTVSYWMKHARELSYDIEAYLDYSDIMEEDDAVDSDAKLEYCMEDSDDKTEYSVHDLDATMEDSIDDSDDKTKFYVHDSAGSMQDSICSSDYKISGFRTRAEGMIDRYKRFSLVSVLSSPTTATTIASPRPSGDVVLVGMDNQKKELISLLQQKDENDNQLMIVSIFGDEGIGKSTLIQQIWRVSLKEKEIWHDLESEVNIKRAFVRMGKKPDVRMILRSILSQVSPQEEAKDSGVTNLIQNIRKHLEQKRYFIVVDDVPSLSVWDVVGRAFPHCSVGSRIITTTSDKEVALACCSYVLHHKYNMQPLNLGDCKQLFIRTVIGSGTVNLQLSDDVADVIQKKCGGLPLAIMWTAVLLASQPEIKEKLLQLETEQRLCEMEKEENMDCDVKKFLEKNLRIESTPVEILNQVLKLCYSSLPNYLKTCLLYLSVYPENYFFLKEDLVKLWIAECFICTSEEDKVEAAGRYFDVLVSLGLIQRMDINCNKKHHQREVVEVEGEEYPHRVPYVVHPMVSDFITSKSTEDNFITVIDYSQSTVAFKEKIHRLSLHFGSATYATTPSSIGLLSQVRTLTFNGLLNCMPSFVEFKLVRVLILHLWADDGDKKFPLAEICKLLLLKYLQVRGNIAVELPCQIGCLKHLETLEINSVVTAIPSNVFQLSRLLHLCLGLKQSLTPGPVAAVNAISSDDLLPPMDDSSSTSTPTVQISELLLPICIFSRLPKWIPQFCKLSILEIVVRELFTADIDMIADLPALTALSLYVRIPTTGNIVFRRGAFPALKYLRFMCGVLSLDFQEEAVPNLQRLTIEFNVHRREKYDNVLAGTQHLLNLKAIVASIGATMGTEKTDMIAAESALKDGIAAESALKDPWLRRKQAYRTKVIVNRVQQVEEESRPPPLDSLSINEQEEVSVIHGLKTEDCTNKQKMPAKDTHGISQISDQQEENSSTQQKSDLNYARRTRRMNVVTGALGSLAPKLHQLLHQECKPLKGVKKAVQELQNELDSIDAFLRKVSVVPWDRLDDQVKVWARMVREATYDMEDVLDTVLIHVNGREPTDSKLMRGFKMIVNKFSEVKTRTDIAGAIRRITKRIKMLADVFPRYKLPEMIMSKPDTESSIIAPHRTAMYKEMTQLIGVEKSRDEIISMLNVSQADDDIHEKKIIKKVSIVGVGGVGKTTLAKAVYDNLKSQYDCGAFVSIGRDPDWDKVFKDILFGLGENGYDNTHNTGRRVDILIGKVQEFLQNKRYFLVVDDVWDVQTWERMKHVLVENNCGSTVISTTRKFDVAEEAGEVYTLKPLSHDDSVKLFYARIFGADGMYFDNQPDDISNKILKKCGGIPLAITIMTSLLVGKPKSEWSEIYNSIGFGSKGYIDVEDTMTIISFSYYDLPQHLRTCLLYLSTYPKDYVIIKDSLICKWIAEGFINGHQGERLFELGEKYFNDLINRSLIEAVNSRRNGRVQGCHVHDMVLDLMRKLSFEENFFVVSSDSVEVSHGLRNVHWLAHQNRTAEHIDSKAMVTGVPTVRSYSAFMCSIDSLDQFLSFKLLRVLDIVDCYFKEGCRLDHLVDLRYLRYLRIKRSEGSDDLELPKQIRKLKLLQTLDVHGPLLPESIVRLTKLVRLRALGMVPNGIGNLVSLEDLRITDGCSDKPELFLKELGSLRELRVLKFAIDGMDEGMQKDFLGSLSKMQKLQHINVYGSPWHADTVMWDEAGLVLPRSLLYLEWSIEFSKLPPCINPAHLLNLSHLILWVTTMDEQDLKLLATLPALCFLLLRTESTVTANNINADDGSFFQNLRYLVTNAMVQFEQPNEDDTCVSLHMWNGKDAVPFASRKSNDSIKVVPSGVMPNLGVLDLYVSLRALKDNKSDCGNIGLEYLPSLRELRGQIDCRGVPTAESDAAVAALRNTCNIHPNHPTFDMWQNKSN